MRRYSALIESPADDVLTIIITLNAFNLCDAVSRVSEMLAVLGMPYGSLTKVTEVPTS